MSQRETFQPLLNRLYSMDYAVRKVPGKAEIRDSYICRQAVEAILQLTGGSAPQEVVEAPPMLFKDE